MNNRNNKNGFKDVDPLAEAEAILAKIPKPKKHYTSQAIQTRLQVSALFSELVEKVSLKQFSRAEKLRKKIFDIDSMATQEIVDSGILINNEKLKYQIAKPITVLKQSEKAFESTSFLNISDFVNPSASDSNISAFPDIWKELYKEMSSDEINIFTKALKSVSTQTSKTLLKQGMLNNYLYFINSGQVKVIGVTNGNLSVKKTLNPGDIACEDVFFSNAPSPVSVIAAKGSGIDYIKKNDLYQLCSIYPSIGKSLFDYCNKHGKTTATLYSKGLNQRGAKRISTSGTADLQLMKPDNQQNLGKPFTGKILDISQGGLALEINKIKSELARKLINKSINILLNLNNFNTPLLCSGDITGVHRKSRDSYTLHLKWDQASEKLSQAINWLTHH